MRADPRRTEQSEREREESIHDDDSIAEDWNVQLLGGLPREDGEESAEPSLPSAERISSSSAIRR